VVYTPCLYVLNKVDAITIEELDLLDKGAIQNLKKNEKYSNIVFTIYTIDCNYRYNHFYLFIPLLMCSLKSYLSNKPKQCILTYFIFCVCNS